MQLEKDWKQYPVIRLDMSRGGANAETIRSYLDIRFGEYEEFYGITPKPTAMIAKFIDNIELRLSNFEQCTIMRNILWYKCMFMTIII